MAKKKKITKVIKLQIPAGKANPAPPVGPALGAAGLNIMAFCKDFNARTQDKGGDVLPVEITVYEDKSFEFITKEPPVPVLIKKELGLAKGSAVPNRDKVGRITLEQVMKIVQRKKQDFNADTEEAAAKIVLGTCRSMGVDLVEG